MEDTNAGKMAQKKVDRGRDINAKYKMAKGVRYKVKRQGGWGNKAQNQKLISDIENKIKSMGLVIKPSKCASLSIQSGKSAEVTFNLTENGTMKPIELIKNKPQKFLGSIVTALNKPQEMFTFLSEKLNKKLENIDNSSLRGENKLKIYSRYALISMRYHLSVHDIHKIHLDKLDNIARKFLKKWLNIPSHGASDISIFHPYVLGVKTPSQLYLEGHAGNYTMMRLKFRMIRFLFLLLKTVTMLVHQLDTRFQKQKFQQNYQFNNLLLSSGILKLNNWLCRGTL